MRTPDTPEAIDPNAGYESTIRWYGEHADEYASKIEDLEPEEIRAFGSRLSPFSKVVDIGCAAGRDTNFFSKRHQVIGIDVVPEFINIASAQHPNCNFLVADATQLPFHDNAFDAVCMRSVLLHMPDDMIKKSLLEAKRVARPGALGFIRVKKRLHEVKYVVGSIERRTTSDRLFNLFTQEEIAALINESGLQIEHIEESEDDDNPDVVCINITVRF